jgi:hypothetical protein
VYLLRVTQQHKSESFTSLEGGAEIIISSVCLEFGNNFKKITPSSKLHFTKERQIKHNLLFRLLVKLKTKKTPVIK